MTNREKILLSITLKDKKISDLHDMLPELYQNHNYQKILDYCEVIINLKNQLDDLNDLLLVDDKKEFDEQFETLKKYLEV